MRSYEVKEEITLTIQKGSVVILTEEQAAAAGNSVAEQGTKKTEKRAE